VPRRWPHETELLVSAPRWKVAGALRLRRSSATERPRARAKAPRWVAIEAPCGRRRLLRVPSPSQFLGRSSLALFDCAYGFEFFFKSTDD
jgi:hypothetical protein